MLVLPTLHTYLSQLLSPPSIHTALLLTPEGALVSYASQTTAENSSGAVLTHGSQSGFNSPTVSGAGGIPSSPCSVKSNGSLIPSTPQGSEPGSVVSIGSRTRPAPQRSKDEIRMAAGLGAEAWAETKGEEAGMVESEVRRVFYIDDGYTTTSTSQLGRILVLAVEEGTVSEDAEPLLLLAVNGTMEADWDAMRVKACPVWFR